MYISTGSSPTIRNCVIRDTAIRGGHASGGLVADATSAAGRGGWAGGSFGGGVFIDSARTQRLSIARLLTVRSQAVMPVMAAALQARTEVPISGMLITAVRGAMRAFSPTSRLSVQMACRILLITNSTPGLAAVCSAVLTAVRHLSTATSQIILPLAV